LFNKITGPAPGGNYSQEIVPDSMTKKLLTKDPSPVVFIALAGGSPNKKKIYWTSTASVKL
jgi:hypothetical protein